jgi:type I restriction enzyme S subunit
MHGSAGQKRVPDDYIRNLYLGLPSIEEQQQIVCYVHEKLRSIEALNALTSLSMISSANTVPL